VTARVRAEPPEELNVLDVFGALAVPYLVVFWEARGEKEEKVSCEPTVARVPRWSTT
jgi:hypothetical protein